MRLKKIFPCACLGLALGLAACSSEEVAPNAESNSFADGGYVSLSVQLPIQNGTRAANDVFDDGLASEYDVKDATLILFQGATEAEATFHSAYDLTDQFKPTMEGSTTDQITLTSRIVKKLNNNENAAAKNLYALVVLNKNEVLSVSNNGLSVNGNNFTSSFENFNKLIVNGTVAKFNKNGFFMANAALATTAGGATACTGEAKMLADVTGKVYKTEAEAIANPATDVFVERAMGKVTVQPAQGKITGAEYGDEATRPTWEVESWALDVTNNSSYILHHVDGFGTWKGYENTLATINKPYRFVGDTPVKDASDGYRIYWGEDPNYSTFALDDYTYITNEAAMGKLGNENPQYCFENTFNVANQIQNRTTQAIVKVKIGSEGDFYIVNGDKTKLYSKEAVANLVTTNLKNAAFVAATKAWIDARVEEIKAMDAYKDGQHTIVVELSDFEFKANQLDKLAAGNLNSVTVTADATVTVDGSEVRNLASTYEAQVVGSALSSITKYKGGYAYYPVRIKHFGDDLTPWSNANGDVLDEGCVAGDSYGYTKDQTIAEQNFLGRYGVLRNNWYDLSITSIKALGSATVEDLNIKGSGETDTNWDDELYNYISVRINVLSWAKRTQNVEL